MSQKQMSDIHDIFLRAHTVVLDEEKKKRRSRRLAKEVPWPDYILCYDCETLTDATLKLTFGAYRICRLVDGLYRCEEEGLFYPPGVNPADPHFTLITRFTSTRQDWINSKCINIHDCESPTYRLQFDYSDDGASVSPVNFYQLAESYQNHPEAKSLGPDGTPCEFDTTGLLQRAHVVAGEHIPIGKESDRHWEDGEHISLLEFKAIQFRRRGKLTATNEELQRVAKVSKKELRRRGINQHTLEKICRKEAVRASRLAKVLKVLQRWESEQGATAG